MELYSEKQTIKKKKINHKKDQENYSKTYDMQHKKLTFSLKKNTK